MAFCNWRLLKKVKLPDTHDTEVLVTQRMKLIGIYLANKNILSYKGKTLQSLHVSRYVSYKNNIKQFVDFYSNFSYQKERKQQHCRTKCHFKVNSIFRIAAH